MPIGWFVVPPDDPCLEGHFPGSPLVPGVILLDEVIASIEGSQPGLMVAEVTVAKFTGAVLPGQVVEISCDDAAADRVAFACSVTGRTVARGLVRLASVPS